MNIGMKGKFKIHKQKVKMQDGEPLLDDKGCQILVGAKEEVASFNNLITNQGLDNLHVHSIIDTFYISSENTEPTVDDSSISGVIASSRTAIASGISKTSITAPNYYRSWYKTVRFAAGTAANVAKVAVGWDSGYWAIQLVKDSSGMPTVITKLADEILDITYELEFHISVEDVVGVINISGEPYNYIMRPCNLNAYWFPDQPPISFGMPAFYIHSGTLGSITGEPGGTSETVVVTKLGYVTGSYEIGYTANVPLNQGNYPTGIRSIHYFYQAGGNGYIFQAEFSRVSDGAAIVKTNLQTLRLPPVYIKWGRYVTP